MSAARPGLRSASTLHGDGSACSAARRPRRPPAAEAARDRGPDPHWSDPQRYRVRCARLPISGNPRTASAVGPCAPPAAGVLIADVRGTPDAAAGERRAHDERPTAPAVRRVRPGVRAAPRRQDGDGLDRPAARPRRPVAGLHARCRPGLHGDRRAPGRWSTTYTWKSNVVAVVTDGTAVLGLGDIGPAAALPVMEGKAVLFKQFGGVDAVPICLDATDVDEIVETVVRLAPAFGGINLEDISAPRCFEIEHRLEALLDIPVFHDDQHGTAIVVVLAALRNAARLTGRSAGRPARRHLRRGRGRRRGHDDPAGGGHRRHRGGRPRRRPARGTATTSPRSSAAGRRPPTRRPDGQPRRGAARRRRLHRRVRRHGPGGGGGRRWPTDAIVFALANPKPEVHPEVAARYARGGRHRPQRLPEPDQQRARLPRHLPRARSTCGPRRSPRA